jgi:hypothetical protein
MEVMERDERKRPRARRSFTAEFKAEIVQLCQQGRVGWPGGVTPRAPPERSVTVSRHSAPAILIIRGFLTHAQWAK